MGIVVQLFPALNNPAVFPPTVTEVDAEPGMPPTDRAMLDILRAALPPGWEVEVTIPTEEEKWELSEHDLLWWARISHEDGSPTRTSFSIHREVNDINFGMFRMADKFWPNSTHQSLTNVVMLIQHIVFCERREPFLATAETGSGH